jgi:hypothetical protein
MKNLAEENKRSQERKPTMYDASQYKEKAPLGKILLVIGFVVVLLLVIRFLNLILWWNVTRLELTHDPLTEARVGDYSFLGFSGSEAAREKLANLVTLHKVREITVISYFDFLHPAVFLIQSRSSKPYVNLGRMSVYPDKGFTALFFHPTEILETRRQEAGRYAVYFGNSLFPKLYETLAGYISSKGRGEGAKDKGAGISFMVKSIEETRYLTIPYYIYFYLSLLAIFILGAHYGSAFYISFFYYLGLFLLFDFKKVLLIVPFQWLINLLGVNISQPLAVIITAGIVTLFAAGGFIGILNSCRREQVGFNLTIWGKGLIFFFLLLPLSLRF